MSTPRKAPEASIATYRQLQTERAQLRIAVRRGISMLEDIQNDSTAWTDRDITRTIMVMRSAYK